MAGEFVCEVTQTHLKKSTKRVVIKTGPMSVQLFRCPFAPPHVPAAAGPCLPTRTIAALSASVAIATVIGAPRSGNREVDHWLYASLREWEFNTRTGELRRGWFCHSASPRSALYREPIMTTADDRSE
jgi:hypothetical protein